MTPQTKLKELNDINGVVGSFVLSARGECKLSDMPSVVSSEVLDELSPRVVRMLEAFAEDASIEGCALRFTNHRLSVRPAGPLFLCVLADNHVNVPMLQMGMTLVARHLVAMPPDEPSAVPAEPAPAVEPSQTLSPPARQPLIYRGQRLER